VIPVFVVELGRKKNHLVFRDWSRGLVDRLLSAAKSHPRIYTNSHEKSLCEVALGIRFAVSYLLGRIRS
jgi:hypothetical protein